MTLTKTQLADTMNALAERVLAIIKANPFAAGLVATAILGSSWYDLC